MSEKKTDSTTTMPTKKSSPPARKKKSTLSQQVKAQAEQIEQLNNLLKQKEQDVASLQASANLADELTQQLKESEQAQKLDNVSTTQTQEKELLMTTSAEQIKLIDELTNKLLKVKIKLASTTLQNKHVVAKNIVKSHMVAGMSLGLIPAALFDIVALTGTQINMLRMLSKHYDINFDEQKGKVLLSSLVGSSLPVMTVLGLSSFAKLIPGIGTIGGSFSMAVLSGAVVYATGQVFIRHFDLGGTLEDFDSKYWQTYFKQEFEEGKLLVKSQLKKQKLRAQES